MAVLISAVIALGCGAAAFVAADDRDCAFWSFWAIVFFILAVLVA